MDIEQAKASIGKKVEYFGDDKELIDHLGTFIGYGSISSIYDHIYVGVKNLSGRKMYFKAKDLELSDLPTRLSVVQSKEDSIHICALIDEAKRNKFKVRDRVYADVVSMIKDGADMRMCQYLRGGNDLSVCEIIENIVKVENKNGELFLIPSKYLEHIPKCMIDKVFNILEPNTSSSLSEEESEYFKKWLLSN